LTAKSVCHPALGALRPRLAEQIDNHRAFVILEMVLLRRTFLVFGALGLFGYLGHLAYRVFNDSLLFPFALSLLGIGIIYLGLQYQRRRKQIEQCIRSLIVPHIRSLIPPRALEE
jgi:hypothetical protein